MDSEGEGGNSQLSCCIRYLGAEKEPSEPKSVASSNKSVLHVPSQPDQLRVPTTKSESDLREGVYAIDRRATAWVLDGKVAADRPAVDRRRGREVAEEMAGMTERMEEEAIFRSGDQVSVSVGSR